jgi:hypothetical protein
MKMDEKCRISSFFDDVDKLGWKQWIKMLIAVFCKDEDRGGGRT